jgi:phage terminase small subunit
MAAKDPKGLTPKEEIFARALSAKKNYKAAAIEAGYSETGAAKEGSRMAALPRVQARVQELLNEGAKLAAIDAAWVFQGVKEIRDRGLEETPIIVKGEVVGSKPQNLGAAARATELGAKLLDMMVDRHQVEMSGEVKEVLERVIQAIVTEVEDPVIRERIIARIQGEGVGAPIPN